jgi:hypothetical protein
MDNKGLKKIPVRQLRLGMYVHEFCGSWMELPFWRSRFLLHTEADLDRVVQSGIEELWIDPAKGCDVAGGVSVTEVREEGERELEFAASMPMPLNTAESTQAALAKATALYRRSVPRIASLFSEARLGRALGVEGEALRQIGLAGPWVQDKVVACESPEDWPFKDLDRLAGLQVPH